MEGAGIFRDSDIDLNTQISCGLNVLYKRADLRNKTW